MLCTLQEAYNIPSFDGGSKKKKACNVQARASAEAFDPYNADTARGQRAALVENFQVGKPMSQEETPMSYKGKATDYEYYRRQYGVQLPQIEGFQTEQQTCGIEGPQMYKIPISQEAKDMYDAAMKTSMEETVPKYIPSSMEPRKVNMDNVSGYYDEELEQYLQTKDMKAAPFAGKSLPPPPPVQRVEVEPTRNDDYKPYRPFNPDMYGNVSNKTESMQGMKKEATDKEDTEPVRETPTIISNDAWQNFWDIFLFIFAGILVMFLCEQLFKLALMIGMKRTVEILEPYLK